MEYLRLAIALIILGATGYSFCSASFAQTSETQFLPAPPDAANSSITYNSMTRDESECSHFAQELLTDGAEAVTSGKAAKYTFKAYQGTTLALSDAPEVRESQMKKMEEFIRSLSKNEKWITNATKTLKKNLLKARSAAGVLTVLFFSASLENAFAIRDPSIGLISSIAVHCEGGRSKVPTWKATPSKGVSAEFWD